MEIVPVPTSIQAEASSAHSRINIPLNLENWKDLSEDIQRDLLWFHQHALDEKLSLSQCAEALNYDGSTVFRVLKGNYEGNWSNIHRAIRSYRKLIDNRGTIQRQEFVENTPTSMVWDALDYALANNSITLIAGESGMGKSTAAEVWRDRNNHGRSALVRAPAYGGTKALLRSIASTSGVNKNMNAMQMYEGILRAFNRNRILIIDEAHRLLPSDRRTNPVNLEILRDIHDLSGAAVALIGTHRLRDTLKQLEYMYEQLLGRIGLPVRLPTKLEDPDYLGIVRQYVPRPTKAMVEQARQIVATKGALRLLVEILKLASRMAAKKREPMQEHHVFLALKWRKQMSGGEL